VSDTLVCFLAVRVPTGIAEHEHIAVRALFGAAGRDFRFSRPEGWHVTLYYLGETPKAELGRLHERLRERMEGARAPELELCIPGAFPERGRERVLWIGAREAALDPAGEGRLADLHARSLAAVEDFGRDTRKERRRGFVPHVTVARPRSRSPRVPEPFYEHAPEGAWRPGVLELLESVRGDGPSRYETLEAFPFEG